MILAVCLNPTLQKTLVFPSLREGEVNRSAAHYLDASGKGVNVARVLAGLGRDAVHLTHSGGRNRDLFLSLAAADGVRISGPDSGSEIRFCYTLVNRENGTATEIVEESPPVGAGVGDRVRKDYMRLVPGCGLVVISGTKAPGYPDALYPDFVRTAKEAGKRVLLDLRGGDLRRCLDHGPDIIKPNFAEFAATFVTGGKMGGETDAGPDLIKRVEEEAAAVSRRGTAVILTRGHLPALCALGGEVFYSPAEKVQAVNTVGCGDAFAAGFAAAWEEAGLPAAGTGEFSRIFDAAVGAGHRAAAANAAILRPGRIR